MSHFALSVKGYKVKKWLKDRKKNYGLDEDLNEEDRVQASDLGDFESDGIFLGRKPPPYY